MNPNLTYSIIKNNPDKDWDLQNLLYNSFCYHEYYTLPIYKKKLVKKFMETCWEELIQKACHPSRIENWNEGYMEMYNFFLYFLYFL